MPNTDGPVSQIIAKGDTLFVCGNFTQFSNSASRVASFKSTSDIPSPLLTSGTYNTIISDGNGGWYVGGGSMNMGSENRTE
ncbi:MAG: hypothetical protein IPP51_03370 [Bacteroidetes bacterium]|nr:hypothetical protein [Bacteroidota bacterium]